MRFALAQTRRGGGAIESAQEEAQVVDKYYIKVVHEYAPCNVTVDKEYITPGAAEEFTITVITNKFIQMIEMTYIDETGEERTDQFGSVSSNKTFKVGSGVSWRINSDVTITTRFIN